MHSTPGGVEIAVGGFYSEEADWTKNADFDGGKPYSIWNSPSMPWWCVVDCNNHNVMTRGTGHVFTSEEVAKRLCEAWNA